MNDAIDYATIKLCLFYMTIGAVFTIACGGAMGLCIGLVSRM